MVFVLCDGLSAGRAVRDGHCGDQAARHDDGGGSGSLGKPGHAKLAGVRAQSQLQATRMESVVHGGGAERGVSRGEVLVLLFRGAVEWGTVWGWVRDRGPPDGAVER